MVHVKFLKNSKVRKGMFMTLVLFAVFANPCANFTGFFFRKLKPD